MTNPMDLIAEMRRLAESLPSRVASVLRVGPGVAELLRLAAEPARTPNGRPNGVRIVPDDTYRAGEWRLLDQWDEELRSGQIEALAGMPADVRVIVSPYLPAGVDLIAISPSGLHPEDPDYPPFGVHAAVVVRGTEETT